MLEDACTEGTKRHQTKTDTSDNNSHLDSLWQEGKHLISHYLRSRVMIQSCAELLEECSECVFTWYSSTFQNTLLAHLLCLTLYDFGCLCFHCTRTSWATTRVTMRMSTISACMASWPLCLACIFACSTLWKKKNILNHVMKLRDKLFVDS